jgi:hypothetical protein
MNIKRHTPPIMSDGVTQRLSKNVTATHNVKAWEAWFEETMADRFCTFLHAGKRTLGRVQKHGKFLGMTSPGSVPNYEVIIGGPSGKSLTTDMDKSEVSIKENLEEAEKDCGYTWASRKTQVTYPDTFKEGKKKIYASHYDKMKDKLAQAEKDYKQFNQ